MKTIQSTVAFTDAQNNALANGSLILDLSQNAEVTSGGGQVVPKRVVITLDANGKIPAATQVFANDELTPSGTTYAAYVFDSGGIKGYSLGNWNIAGASPIDLSAMTPTTTAASYPSPVLLVPAGNQTITTGNLTLSSGNLTVSGAVTAGSESVTGTSTLKGGSGQNRLLVDNNPFATAGSFGVHTQSLIDTITPAPDQPTKYPLGDDGGFAVYGPADIHLMPLALEVTSTTSVGAPGSVTVTVTSPTVGGTAQAGNATALFSGPGGAALIIEPGGANQETVAIANWSIASGTTLTITFAKTHTQPYRIRQQGVTLFESDLQASPDRTSQLTQNYIRDGSGQINIGLSNAASVASWPLSGLQLGNIVTGGTNLANGNLVFRMNNASSVWQFVNAANTQVLINLDNSGRLQTTAVGGQSNAGLQSVSATPFISFDATGQAADQKWWDVGVVGTQLQFRAVNDANNAATNWLVVNRGAAQAVTSVGLGTIIGNYNGINTVGGGVPAEYATVDLTAQTAAVGTTTLYAVPASGAGQYRLSWNAKVTTAAGVSSTLGALTIVYTDPDGVAQTITAGAQTNAGAIATTSTGNSTTTVLLGLPMLLNCKASTNITYAMAYASNAANAMAYNLHIKLEAL